MLVTCFSRRVRWIGIGVGLVALVLAFVAIVLHMRQEQQRRTAIDEARHDMARGRFGLARGRLAELAGRWPADGAILVPLGQCEETLGHLDRALKAWAHVPETDPQFGSAAESRGLLLINRGQYAPAEHVLFEALRQAPDAKRSGLLRALARLFRLEGRFVEVSEVLVASWNRDSDRSRLLQDLWQNDTEPVPVDGWKLFLDRADDHDDRVWLGRARLAFLSGQFDEAERWLARCLERRPDDGAVWSARLDLALATDDEAKVWEAAGRLADGELRPWQVAALRGWLAQRRGDRRVEQRELTALVDLHPSHTRSLERLAVLAVEAGQPEEAAKLRQRKGEIDRAKDRIHKFVVRKIDFQLHTQELSRLCSVLGRQFDAAGWSIVGGETSAASAARRHCQTASNEALQRLLESRESAGPRPAATITDRLADLRGAARDVVETTAASTTLAFSPRLRFVDDAAAVGLRFTFDNGQSPMWLLPEILSGGVGLIDFDGDGWLDVYGVQGGSTAGSGSLSPSDPPVSSAPSTGDRLFRNQGDGTFADVTRAAGLDALARGRAYGQGVAVGDYDDDGYPDLFITRLGRYDLLRNRGDGCFEDVTERAGLAGARENPTSAAFADLDGDGDLDLYVCHYARWDEAAPPSCRNERGEPYYCDPAKYERAKDHVFRNDGGHFTDVTESAGFTDPDGRGLGVVAADLDDDNRIDLYVANDGTSNYLFRNQGAGRFADEALTAGAAGNAEGAFRAGMGVAAADLDADGRPELLVGNLYGEGATLYHNLGGGMFADESAGTGLLQATRYLTTFGVGVFDATNRGGPYVALANGHVNDFRPLYPFAMPCRLYEARAGGRLVDVSAQAGPSWEAPRLGRGLAPGDLDNDGRVDLAVMAQDLPLAYFHNLTENAGHFVTFLLEGTTSNRDGVGARMVVVAGHRRQVAQRIGGGSYLSAVDGRLHFGLGDSSRVELVEVRWPGGRLDRWQNLAADRGYLLREGDPTPRPLTGFAGRHVVPVGRSARRTTAVP